MKITFAHGNEYFDTYNIYDDARNNIGLLEDHCRGVRKQYFVGWRLGTPNKTRSFDKRADAIEYITAEEER